MGGPRKKNHFRRGAGEDKHVSGFDEVMRRNKDGPPEGKGKGKQDDEPEESSSSEEEAKPQVKSKGPVREAGNPNRQQGEDEEPQGLSRKQREELEKERARRRYEELHKQGKTDEAKADLARLDEVKKRREEAAKKRAEEEAAAKEKEKDSRNSKSGMSAEMKEALGGEAARLKGARSQAKKEKDGEEAVVVKTVREPTSMYIQYGVSGDSKVEKNEDKKDGTIQSCRAAEEDFM